MAEEKNYPILTGEVLQVLTEMQEPNGMFDMYDTLLSRIEDILFIHGEDIGLPDSDVLSYLRILRLLRKDLRNLGMPEEEKNDEIDPDANI